MSAQAYYNNTSLKNIEGEIWKPCVFYNSKGELLDYSNIFLISNKGRVKVLARVDCRNQKRHERILKQEIVRWGYCCVTLSYNSVNIKMGVHRLACFAFYGKPNDLKMQGNHINAIRTDNRIENLEWVTISNNIKHAYSIGTKKVSGAFAVAYLKKGHLNHNSKGVIQIDLITNKEIARFSCDREAAEKMNVTRKSINSCVLGISKTSAGFKWERL